MNIEVDKLFQQQLGEWPLAAKNFNALSEVKTKEVSVNGVHYRVQFNPARIVSSAAKVDSASIQARKCFLCATNRPIEQKGINYKQYVILLNPFPIFPRHLTIPDINHVDQKIEDRICDMLDLAKKIDDYVLFYNGPKCGASAPDHMHFQAGNKGFLCIEKDVTNIPLEKLKEYKSAKLFLLNDNPRNSLIIKGTTSEDINELFNQIYHTLPVQEGESEPMMNLIAWYDKDEWTLILLLRKKHRPNAFFAKGENKLTISPASVDLGGVFITPLEIDFNKVNEKQILEIVSEVSMSKEEIINLLKK